MHGSVHDMQPHIIYSQAFQCFSMLHSDVSMHHWNSGMWRYCSLCCTSTIAIVCVCVCVCIYNTGIAWTLYNLATHPEHQEKCRQEVDTVFNEKEEGNVDITRYIMTACLLPWVLTSIGAVDREIWWGNLLLQFLCFRLKNGILMCI